MVRVLPLKPWHQSEQQMNRVLPPKPWHHSEQQLGVDDEEVQAEEEENQLGSDDEGEFESDEGGECSEEENDGEELWQREAVDEQVYSDNVPDRASVVPQLSEYFFEAWLQSLQVRFELPSEALKQLASEGLSKQVDFTHRFASEDEVGMFCDTRGLSGLTKTRLRQAWVNCRRDADQADSDIDAKSKSKRRRLDSQCSGRTTTAGSHISSQDSCSLDGSSAMADHQPKLMIATSKSKAKKPSDLVDGQLLLQRSDKQCNQGESAQHAKDNCDEQANQESRVISPCEVKAGEQLPSERFDDQLTPTDMEEEEKEADEQSTHKASDESMPVPHPWKKIWSDSHSEHYYWNPDSNISTWQHPDQHKRHCQTVAPEADSCIDVPQPNGLRHPSAALSPIKLLLARGRLGKTGSPAQGERVRQWQPASSSPVARLKPTLHVPHVVPPPIQHLASSGRLCGVASSSHQERPQVLMPPPPPSAHPSTLCNPPPPPVASPPSYLADTLERQTNSHRPGTDSTEDGDVAPTKVVDGMWEAQYTKAVVDVDSLRFTQSGCSEVFQCGRTLEQTACELVDNGTKGSLPDWCELRVISRNGIYWSCDNRRLWALKEAQRRMRASDPSTNIQVNIKLFYWHPAFDVFMAHVDHGMSRWDGESIKVRGQVRRRPFKHSQAWDKPSKSKRSSWKRW